jgi:hypothetical protein
VIEISLTELGYAGGLFTGEGCITAGRPKPDGPIYPRLSIYMTDLPPLERFHAAVGGLGTINGPYKTGLGKYGPNKDRYAWATNSFEQFQAVVAMLWPWLCPRRRARATQIMDEYLAWDYPALTDAA